MAIVFNPFTGGFFVVPNPTFPGTLVIASGKTATINNTITLAGTDAQTYTFPTTTATLARTDADSAFTAAQTLTKTINATSADGWSLVNSTAASAGAQQWSPRIRLTGQGWKTTSTAASQPVDWIIENQPAQGSTAPTANLVLSQQINGGGYASTFSFKYNGSNDQLVFAHAGGAGVENFKGPSVGIYDSGSSALGITVGGSLATSINASNINIWSTTGNFSINLDTILTRDAPDTLAQRHGAAAQTFNLGNTVTTPLTAGEWFTIDWQTTANVVNLQAVRGSSSGTARVMTLSYGGLKASPVAAITIPITSGNIVFGGGVQLSNAAVTGLTPGALAALTTATIVLYDSTGQAYRVPCVI